MYLQRVESNLKPARILCLAEDKSCRFISPVTGQSITISLPLLEDINIKKVAYALDYDRLYALLWDSSIIVISTTTNPCHLIEEWGNSFSSITDIIVYDPSKSMETQEVMPYFILGCSDAGQILVLDPEKRITLDEMKKHEYFKDISFLKVYKKQYGPIKIKKKDKNSKNSPVLVGEEYFVKTEEQKVLEEKLKKAKEHDNYIQFKAAQLKLDEDKNFTFLDGKISVKEMKKDQKRDMKNYVREFYFVKKEDVKQNIDFHLTVNEKQLNEK